MASIMRSEQSLEWTQERISALTTPEVRQLRDNAERLQEPEIVATCEEILRARPRTGAGARKPRK